jgi:phosphoglycolate phosphatase
VEAAPHCAPCTDARQAGPGAQIALFPGVDAMLAQLAAAGIKLAVVSSNSEETVRHVLGPANSVRITHDLAVVECGVTCI